MAELRLIFTCCFVLVAFVYAESPLTCTSCYNPQFLRCNANNNQSNIVLKRVFIKDETNVQSVTLRACAISELEYDALANLSSLLYLDLSDNLLTDLKTDTFDYVQGIVHLNVSKNIIYRIQDDVFANTTELLELDLSDNVIFNLSLGVFDSLTKLKILDLSRNILLGAEFNASLFDYNTQIYYISLQGNDMNDTPDNLFNTFKVLEILNLNECALDKVPKFATKSNLKTLKELTLSSNKITELEDEAEFVNLVNIEILDLSSNELIYITEKLFVPLKKLKILTLRDNKLSSLPDRLFKNLQHLENIDLSHNMITEISPNLFYDTPVNILNLAYNRFTYLPKNFSLKLKTAGASLKVFHFNKNPWQCACLKAVLDETEEFHIEHNLDIAVGKDPICVTLSENICERDQKVSSVFRHMYDKLQLE